MDIFFTVVILGIFLFPFVILGIFGFKRLYAMMKEKYYKITKKKPTPEEINEVEELRSRVLDMEDSIYKVEKRMASLAEVVDKHIGTYNEAADQINLNTDNVKIIDDNHQAIVKFAELLREDHEKLAKKTQLIMDI